MLGTPTGFWGKLRRASGSDIVEQWHSLEDHCLDVAAVCEALLTGTILGRRLARLAGTEALDVVTIARLVVIALLHDLGKFHRGFQNKAFPDRKPQNGHVAEALQLLQPGGPKAQRSLVSLGLERWGVDAAQHLLLASISHHGRPVSSDRAAGALALWAVGDGLDPSAGIASLCTLARSFAPAAFDSGPALPSSPAFQHAFAGLVMLADWLGSDTSVFPFTAESDTEPRAVFARRAAHDVLARMGLSSTRARATLGGERPSFARVTEDFAPNAAQREVAHLPPDVPHGSLSLLESETGSGKTEAALARFLVLFQAGLVDGLYFALPTRTAATQLHQRVRAVVQHAFGEAAPPVVLAVPGYLSVDEMTGTALPNFEVLWNDGKQRLVDRARTWAAESPKRFLAGAIVVGTIDQVLLSALAVEHAHLRATALMRHLLVVDEVHASDAYMTRLLEVVLDGHLSAGGHALLLSATLGTAAEARLFGVVDRIGERAVSPARPIPPLEAALRRPYPLVSHVSLAAAPAAVRAREPERRAVTAPGREKRVHLELCAPLGPQSIAERALAEARRGARVIVLCNLVRDCVDAQRALEAAARSEDGPLLFRIGCSRLTTRDTRVPIARRSTRPWRRGSERPHPSTTGRSSWQRRRSSRASTSTPTSTSRISRRWTCCSSGSGAYTGTNGRVSQVARSRGP